MNVIKLQPDQYGSVWYLPEGLPGALAIFNRSQRIIIFLIKKQGDRITKDYIMKNNCPYIRFAGEGLHSNWGYDSMLSSRRNNRMYIPYGYRYISIRLNPEEFHISRFGYIDVHTIDQYINIEFNSLKFVYDHNQTFSTKVRRRLNCLYQSMKSWYYRMQ